MLYKEWPEVDSGIGLVLLFVVLTNLIMLPFYLRLTYPEVVNLDEVKSIRLKSGFGNPFLNIKLKNGQIRRIAGLDRDLSSVRAYISANFPA